MADERDQFTEGSEALRAYVIKTSGERDELRQEDDLTVSGFLRSPFIDQRVKDALIRTFWRHWLEGAVTGFVQGCKGFERLSLILEMNESRILGTLAKQELKEGEGNTIPEHEIEMWEHTH